jgi:hypothetical protein
MSTVDESLTTTSIEPCNRHERRARAARREADLPEELLPAHQKTLASWRRAAEALPLEVVLLSTKQVAKALAVSQLTVWRYSQRGWLMPLKLGSGAQRCPRRYRAVDVLRLIEERLAAGAAATGVIG